VGDVDIHYVPSTDDPSTGSLTVRYTLFDDFFLNEVHIHVAGPDESDKLPLGKNGYTVAPGSFGCGTHKEVDCTVTAYSKTPRGVFEAKFIHVPETSFYVSAHASVSGARSTFSDHPRCPLQ
jgi:hypothetical protein